jgi:hypothetical protein
MPRPVRLTFAVLCVILFWTALLGLLALSDSPGVAFGMGLGVLKGLVLIWAVWAGQRLAWYWLRVVGTIAVVFLTVTTILAWHAGPSSGDLVSHGLGLFYGVMKAVGLYLVVTSLGTAEARAYFGIGSPARRSLLLAEVQRDT